MDERDYPPLPNWSRQAPTHIHYDADQMRAYVDADRAQRAPQALTDAELQSMCRRLKLPRVMWDTEGFRAHLLALIAADRADHDCALKRGSVICRECDLNTIAAHSKTPNDQVKARRQASP